MVYDISITHNIDAKTRIEHPLLCLRVVILYNCSSFSDICDCCNNPISLNQRTLYSWMVLRATLQIQMYYYVHVDCFKGTELNPQVNKSMLESVFFDSSCLCRLMCVLIDCSAYLPKSPRTLAGYDCRVVYCCLTQIFKLHNIIDKTASQELG